MKVKVLVDELNGPAFDWVLAVCEGLIEDTDDPTIPVAGHYWDEEGCQWPIDYSPTTEWAQAGEIIARECISIVTNLEGTKWIATKYTQPRVVSYEGTTPLLAACRCYVAAKLGATVEIPEELAS